MKDLNKIYDFAVLCVAILAAIGGTCYLFYYGQTLFGITNICLVAMSSPYVVERIKDLMK